MAAEIRAAGGNAMTSNLNLTSLDSVRASFAEAYKHFGRIDVLVNNAGITKDGLAMRMKPEDWSLVLQINLTGAFSLPSRCCPAMVKQRSGRIINIASVVGQAGNAGQANYVVVEGRHYRLDEGAWRRKWPAAASRSTRWPRASSRRT